MPTKEEIIKIINKEIKREGKEKLLEFLEKSSFFKDPASDKYHNCAEGGLAEYSLKVYKILKNYQKIYPELEKYDESIAIIGLLHALSLEGTFQKTFKNMPLKNKDGKNAKDEKGKIIFVEKHFYEPIYDNKLPYPDGQLSVIKLKKFLKLTLLEDLAINWHNNIKDISPHIWPLFKQAQKKHKLIFLTCCAVQEAQLFND